MERLQFHRKFWIAFAAASVLIVSAAAILWSKAHPFAVHWDEAEYFSTIQIDLQRLHNWKLLTLGGRILLKSRGKPPAFRLLALPVLGVFGFGTLTARLVSLSCFALSSGFVYLAGRRIAGSVAGAFSVFIFALSPEVLSASSFFGTDTSLYLATAATLYFLFATWSEPEQTKNWVGLGLAIGLGFLSKTSFVAIIVPVLAFWYGIEKWGNAGVPRLRTQSKAAGLALAVAGPWWILNLKSAFDYGHYARDFVRNSLGNPSIGTCILWLNSVLQCLIGHAMSVLIGLVFLAFLVKAFVRKEKFLDPMQKAALGACTSAGLPILCIQLSGTNHLLRHVTPAVIPLAVCVGILADKTGWAHSPAPIAISAALVCVQLAMLLEPLAFPNNLPVDLGFVNGSLPWRTFSRFDQWDWSALRDVGDRCGLQVPKMAYLGNGRAFNKLQIEYPWVLRAMSGPDAAIALPEATWLWRYENGPIDWQVTMSAVDQSDIVLTAPKFTGETRYGENLDNQDNAEFADRLSHDPNFHPPIHLSMGRFAAVDVLAFVNASHPCPAVQFPAVAY